MPNTKAKPAALAIRGDRITAKATLAKQERDMAKVALGAIQAYLRVVARSVAHTRITAAAPPAQHLVDDSEPDDDDLGPDVDLNGLDQAAAWPSILNRTIMPALSQLITGLGPADRMTPSVVTAISAWRAQYLQGRTVALKGVPDTITKLIRDAIQEDADQHGPNPASASSIVKDLLNPDAPMWQNRAQTIARTEVISANNQGGLASWTAVHHSIAAQGGQVYKTWLATEDQYTRPDHADVDGTEVGVGDTFSVGESVMNGPGDESADPGETINCRCTLTYRVDDDAGGDEDVDADDADADADDSGVDDDSLTAAAGAANTGVAIMLGLGPTSEQECAAAGVDVEPPGLHCTVGYLSEPAASYTPEQQAALVTALAALKPEGVAQAFATAQFNPNDPERQPCAVLLVQSQWLSDFHDQVEAAITTAGLAQATTFPIWIPHIAVAYNADTSVIPETAASSDIQFNRLVVGWGGQQIVAAGDGSITAPPEAPVTAAVVAPPAVAAPPAGPPQPADGTPSEASQAPTPGAVQWEGVLAVLDAPAAPGDSRIIASTGLTVRTLPLPLKYQALGEHGGEMSGTTEIVGRILTAEVRGNLLWGTGDFFDPSMCYAAGPAIEQVAGGIGGISVDLPCTVVYYAPGPNGTLLPVDPMTYMGDLADLVQMAEESELAAATIVDVPAFGDARISLIMDTGSADGLGPIAVTADAASPQGPVLTPDSITFDDGTVLKVGDQVNVVDALGSGTPTTGTIEAINVDTNEVSVKVEDPNNPGQTQSLDVDAANLDVVDSMSSDNSTSAASGAASGNPVGGTSGGADGVTAGALTAAIAFPGLTQEHVYPAEWFQPVALDGPTRLTITADGRVYGHAAEFGTCHIGYANECVAPPSSPSGYGYFHVGEVKTTDGMLPVGKLTVGAGHADIKYGWRAAMEHYDNASAAVAVVRAHEDEYGIQVTGALLPNATGTQIAALRRNHLSGDWRPIGGHREMVAAHSINTGGFPLTPRAALAADGSPLALVAAGIVYGPEGSGQPSAGGVTLPSGTKLSPDDVAVLASAWHDVIGQREQAIREEAEKASNVRHLKAGLLRKQLTARA